MASDDMSKTEQNALGTSSGSGCEKPGKHATPLLDELESGPWPSFVTGLKRLRDNEGAPYAPMMNDLLGTARALLRGAAGLLEGRHGFGFRLWRRYHPALFGGRRQVSRVEGISHAARSAAGGFPLRHRYAPQALRHLGEAWFGPDRLPRPERRHHVPGLLDREHPEGVR